MKQTNLEKIVEENIKKPKKKWCYYCKYSGDVWEWVGINHCYCNHPKTFAMEDRRDAIMAVFDTCEDFKLADKYNMEVKR